LESNEEKCRSARNLGTVSVFGKKLIISFSFSFTEFFPRFSFNFSRLNSISVFNNASGLGPSEAPKILGQILRKIKNTRESHYFG